MVANLGREFKSFQKILNTDDDDDDDENYDDFKSRRAHEMAKAEKVNAKETKDSDSNATIKDFEELLSQVLELAWAYNARDIAWTLEEACQKLLNDSGEGTSSTIRKSWAKAIKILGRSFLNRAQKEDRVCQENKVCQNSESEKLDIKARIQVAYATAHMQTSTPNSEEMEEMIRQGKQFDKSQR